MERAFDPRIKRRIGNCYKGCAQYRKEVFAFWHKRHNGFGNKEAVTHHEKREAHGHEITTSSVAFEKRLRR